MRNVNLSIIRELAKQKKITLKEICRQLEISEMGLQYIIKNNSTTLETLGKIADILGVSVGVFFGEKTFSQDDAQKISNKITVLQNTTAIFKKVLQHFFDTFIYNVESFYSGVYYEKVEEKGTIFKSKYKTTEKLSDFWFGDYIHNGSYNVTGVEDFEYEDVYSLFTEYWKLKVDDIKKLYLSGIINKKTFTVFSLFAKSDYKATEFYNLYKKYRQIKELESLENELDKMLDDLTRSIDVSDFKHTKIVIDKLSKSLSHNREHLLLLIERLK